MSVISQCEACRENDRDCVRVGKYLVCIQCLGVYNEVRTMVLESMRYERES